MPVRPVPSVAIALLGPPEVRVAGRPFVVDTRKAVAILALLAAEGRPFAREELAAMLWESSDDAAAHGALRRTLSVLRAALPADVVQVDRARIALRPEAVTIDLGEVERLAQRGRRADLAAAADLARGPFLAGFNLRDSPAFDDWRAARAVSVERLVLGVLDRLAATAEADGDLGAATEAAARRLDLDPLDEGAHVRLMELYERAGDRAAAVRQYRACVAVLERELGVAPLAATTQRYEAIRDAAPTAPPPPTAPSSSPVGGPSGDQAPGSMAPLIGRDELMHAVEAAVAAMAEDGDGRTIVLTGEAGIGKTRVGAAITDRIRSAGGTVLTAVGHRGEGSIAYGAVVDLLRDALRDPRAADRAAGLEPAVRTELARLVPALDPGRRRPPALTGSDATAHARLVGAIVDGLAHLAAGSAPGALWIDDAHWLDPASAEAIAVLARRLSGRPLLVVLAWREEDVTPAVALTLGGLGTEAAIRPAIGRLSPQEVAALLQAAAGDRLDAKARDRIGEASEGLPLYVVEALAAADATSTVGAATVPPVVSSVLRTRLGPVDEVAAQVLAAGAIVGRSFDVATVRHASGRSDDETVAALERLVTRGLVREGPAGYDFAHGALRDVVDEGIGLARRRLLHQRVAEALRLDLGGLGREDLGRRIGIAVHEREAGRTAEAAAAYVAAASRAAELFAHPTTIQLAEAALALGHADPTGLHLLIGRARTRLGEYAGAVAAFEAAAARAEPGGLPAIEWEIGRARLRRGDLAGADRHLGAVVDAPAADARLVARAWVDRSVIRRRSGDPAGAAEAARAALTLASGAGDGAAVGAARRMLGLAALDSGDPPTAVTELTGALEAAQADPDPTARIAALVGLALATAADGDVDRALEHGTAALDDSRRIGDRHLEAAVEDHLADLLHAAGRDEAARDHQRRAVAAFAGLGGGPADPDPGIWMLAAW